MKLTVLTNEYDDCLLYVDGKAYQDIDYRWAECILWLKKVLPSDFEIEHKKFIGERIDYPDTLTGADGSRVQLKMKDRWEIHSELEKANNVIIAKLFEITEDDDKEELVKFNIQMDKLMHGIIKA